MYSRDTFSQERRQRPQESTASTASSTSRVSIVDGLCVFVFAVFRVGQGSEGSTYFPAADSGEEEQDIRLLLLLKLFDVLEGTHLDCGRGTSSVSSTHTEYAEVIVTADAGEREREGEM